MKSIVMSLESRTPWNGPHRSGSSSPRISAICAAEASASVARAMVWLSCTGMRAVSHRQQHRAPVTEETLVDGEPRRRPLDLATVRLAAELPADLADLGERLGGDRLTEAREPTA